jgi:hypothetical protein
VRGGGLAGLKLLLGGREQDQHATHPTCQWRLLPFEQMFGYINPCTSRAVLSIRPQRLYNAKGRSREIPYLLGRIPTVALANVRDKRRRQWLLKNQSLKIKIHLTVKRR